MKIVSIKCPNCNNSLNVTGGRSFCFCEFCGQKIYFDDVDYRSEHTENINITHKTIDEARMLKAKLDAQVRREEIRQKSREFGLGKTLVSIVFIIVAAFFALIAWIRISNVREARELEKAKKEYEAQGLISPGSSSWRFLHENHNVVEAELSAAGFVNIESIKVEKKSEKNKDGAVDRVSIGGNSSFDEDDYFSPDTKVVITYY